MCGGVDCNTYRGEDFEQSLGVLRKNAIRPLLVQNLKDEGFERPTLLFTVHTDAHDGDDYGGGTTARVGKNSSSMGRIHRRATWSRVTIAPHKVRSRISAEDSRRCRALAPIIPSLPCPMRRSEHVLVVFSFLPLHMARRSRDNLHNYVGHLTHPLVRWD